MNLGEKIEIEHWPDMTIDNTSFSADLHQPVDISCVLAHGPELVEYANRVLSGQDRLLVVLEDGNGESKQHFTALIEKRIPYPQHRL